MQYVLDPKSCRGARKQFARGAASHGIVTRLAYGLTSQAHRHPNAANIEQAHVVPNTRACESRCSRSRKETTRPEVAALLRPSATYPSCILHRPLRPRHRCANICRTREIRVSQALDDRIHFPDVNSSQGRGSYASQVRVMLNMPLQQEDSVRFRRAPSSYRCNSTFISHPASPL
jgi:hypothetical protein